MLITSDSAETMENQIAVFANFRIDSEERFLRMQDSFWSFCNANINRWVVNVRGPYKDQVGGFLKKNLGRKLILFDLESEEGWFFDSRKMFDSLPTCRVFFWIEDHICMCGTKLLNELIFHLDINKIDYMEYSWFSDNRLKCYEKINKVDSPYMIVSEYGRKENSICQRAYEEYFKNSRFVISLCAIFSIELFHKIIFTRDPWLRKWPKKLPFDFEKSSTTTFVFPYTLAFPRFEVFAAIDDDNIFPGTSLFSRGLYPARVPRKDMLIIREDRRNEGRFAKVVSRAARFYIARRAVNLVKRISYFF